MDELQTLDVAARYELPAELRYWFKTTGKKSMTDFVERMVNQGGKPSACKWVRFYFAETGVHNILPALIMRFPEVEYIDYQGTDILFMRDMLDYCHCFPKLKELSFDNINLNVAYGLLLDFPRTIKCKVFFNQRLHNECMFSVSRPRPRACDYESWGYRCRKEDTKWRERIRPVKVLKMFYAMNGIYNKMSTEEKANWVEYM